MIRTAPVILVLLMLTACQPDLSGSRPSSSSPSDANAHIELWPPAWDGGIARVVRARIVLHGSSPIDAEGAAWVVGEVGDAHLRQLAEHDPSNAFSERFVPYIGWTEANQNGGLDVVLAPTVPLEAGTLYTVAHGEPPLALELSPSDTPRWPVLQRVWPPHDTLSATTAAVWCGGAALPVAAVTSALDPGPIGGRFLTFATPEQQGAHCVRFEAQSPTVQPPSGGALPPPLIQLGELAVQLDPAPIMGGSADGGTSSSLSCTPDEVSFGPGCALVEDDRLRVRAPDRALLWAISGEGLDEVFATTALEPFTLRPLPPSSHVELRIGTLDHASTRASHAFSTMTKPPMSHVVLNEVLANAKGPEPDQEWVEIVNDGLAPASLGDLTLVDIGGETPLPDVLLAPGAFALLVNEAYVADGEYDPAPAPGTLVLKVPKLGKNGLANAGEPLKLVDEGGAVLSRFPDEPKPKPGVSIARARLDAPDGLASSFARADPPTPGAPNVPSAPGSD